MHYCYLVETYDEPDFVSVDKGIVSGLIEPYYCEYIPDKVHWDWCELGGRWSGEIPGNCCPGSEIPADFHPYGVIGEWGCIDQSWDDPEFWDAFDEMDQDTRLAELRKREIQAAELFDADYEIYPDRWYTLVDFHS